jgi:DNA polymerase III subunit epsilon
LAWTVNRLVTAKACSLLVAADTTTRSKKGDAATKFGIPVASVEDFLIAVQTGTPLQIVRFDKAGVALVCVQCGHSWVATRRSSQPLCSDYK